MPTDLSDLTQKLLRAAQKAGADAADAIAVDGTSVSVDVLNGKLEHAERSDATDIGLRVLLGQKQACVASSLFDDATIETIAERAVAMAREAPEDAHIGLADPSQLASVRNADALDLFDPTDEPSADALLEDALRAEAAALKNTGVTQVQSSSAGYGQRRIHLAASNGFSSGYRRSDRGLSCVAIAGEGSAMERDYYGDGRVFQSDLIDAEEIGRIAAERCVERVGARKPKTGSYPVLFDERISSSLVGQKKFL